MVEHLNDYRVVRAKIIEIKSGPNCNTIKHLFVIYTVEFCFLVLKNDGYSHVAYFNLLEISHVDYSKSLFPLVYIV